MEALLFTISIAFMLLAVAKERTESSHRAAAQTDPLTGIANRRGFLEQSAAPRRRASDMRTAAVLLFDLDHFKSINDRFGHPVGDRALQVFADIAKHAIGSSGLVGRWGGDEFAAVIHEPARGIAERSGRADSRPVRERRRRARRPSDACHGERWPRLQPARPGRHAGLIAKADETLYRAKERGRNRVEAAPPPARRGADPADAVVTSLEAHRRKAASAA